MKKWVETLQHNVLLVPPLYHLTVDETIEKHRKLPEQKRKVTILNMIQGIYGEDTSSLLNDVQEWADSS